MVVAGIDENIEWHILNLFLIACFNLGSIISCLVENGTKLMDFVRCQFTPSIIGLEL